MQSIRQCVQRLASLNLVAGNKSGILSGITRTSYLLPSCNIHGSQTRAKDPTHFLSYNDTIFPPQQPGEEKRPGYVCHMKSNIKYSPLKLWYIACFVRGMTVDEAIKQLSFMHKKGAAIIKDVILEAQRMAVEEHNIEFKSNLWVAESFATKGIVIKGIRRHARMRVGHVKYKHTHYFVRLEEGKPPKHYYISRPKTYEEMVEGYLRDMRMRKITNSL